MVRSPPLRSVALAAVAVSAPLYAEDYEHFEKHVRPLLVEKCYACHSSATTAMGELRLDSREAIREGGSRGPALVAGDPQASLLLRAVSYTSLDLRMPPSGRLADDEIERLEAWIRMGAPDPRSEQAPAVVREDPAQPASGEGWWSLRPVGHTRVPVVDDSSWVRNDIDRFVLARLESAGLAPSPQADRLTLLRRITFDLTGLPPAPEEIESFLADEAPGAYERVVERLLGSPHYGERWGRHWLDLVRWAETNGHEFDNNKLDAWRYRDYVIESFNADLPYDAFVREQIAGDLLAPRLSADGTHHVNPIASGMYWLWEVLNSPTDSVKARADQIDNQIDVLSKATQGLTVACARCHDHKFDPIPTADYYALFGILQSTHMGEACIDSKERERDIWETSARIAEVNRSVSSALGPARSRAAGSLAERLMAAAAEVSSKDASGMAAELQYALTEPSHWLYPFARTAAEEPEPAEFADWMSGLRTEMADWAAKADRGHPIWTERGDEIYEDFESGFGNWNPTGAAFGTRPVRHVPPGQELGGFAGQALAASYGGGADTLVGTLTTEKFRMPARYVHVRISGPEYPRGLRESAPVRLTVIADEHKSGHAMPDGSGRLGWQTIAMTKERGRICSIEIVDRDREASIAVDQIVFSSSPKPPPIAGPVDPRVLELLDEDGAQSLAELALGYQRLAERLAGLPDPGPRETAALTAILGHRDIEAAAGWLDPGPTERLPDLVSRRTELAEGLPESAFAMTSRDWMPGNSRIHVRGNHKNLGPVAPRGYLQAVAGSDQPPVREGSGRLGLANWIASEANPLTARVMANRVWHHHFGRGIVASPDDFGRMGELPTHPDLLDHMAQRFMESGWSVKDLHRMIVTSSTYRAGSAESDLARSVDPSNALLSHFPVRRLEAEAIRDSVLAIAGSLDRTIGGPGIPPHISVYQDGRGKPRSGPLDGLGRRSVYIQVRRNFLPPLFLAFDYPLPISTAGRRGVSAVASQALLMLNNEFINEQAGQWAGRELAAGMGRAERIRSMYVQAFGREPVATEVEQIGRFLDGQAAARGVADADGPADWAELAHSLFNTAEFLFIR